MITPKGQEQAARWPDLVVGLGVAFLILWVLTKNPSAPALLHHSEKDIHYAVLTTIGEAEHEPLEGQLAVLAVIINRLKFPHYQWRDLFEIVTANGIAKNGTRVFQFEPWMSRSKELLKVKKTPADCPKGKQFAVCKKRAKAYVQINYLMRGLMRGELQDPTKQFCGGKGAWFFLNTRTVKRRYGRLPPFAKGRAGLRIGAHTFYCWS